MDFTGIFHGCLTVEKNGDEYHAKRMTDTLRKIYMDEDELFGVRAITTSGITLEFQTAQKAISFDYTTSEPVRQSVSFDIFENGEFKQTFDMPFDGEKKSISFQKDIKGESTVKIYLPLFCDTVLSNINIGDFKIIDKSDLKKYLAIGDSITFGATASSPSTTYPAILAENLNVDLLNHGVGAYYFGANGLDETMVYKPDLITIAYGTNDSGRYETIDNFKPHFDKYMAKFKKMYNGVETYFITPLWRGDNRDESRGVVLDEIREYIKVKAVENGFNYINGLEMLDHVPEMFSDDLLHPCSFGFKHLAENLHKEIIK